MLRVNDFYSTEVSDIEIATFQRLSPSYLKAIPQMRSHNLARNFYESQDTHTTNGSIQSSWNSP